MCIPIYTWDSVVDASFYTLQLATEDSQRCACGDCSIRVFD